MTSQSLLLPIMTPTTGLLTWSSISIANFLFSFPGSRLFQLLQVFHVRVTYVSVTDDEHPERNQHDSGRNAHQADVVHLLDVHCYITCQCHQGDIEGKPYGQLARFKIKPDHRQNFEVEEHEQQVRQGDPTVVNHQHGFLIPRIYGGERNHDETDTFKKLKQAA